MKFEVSEDQIVLQQSCFSRHRVHPGGSTASALLFIYTPREMNRDVFGRSQVTRSVSEGERYRPRSRFGLLEVQSGTDNFDGSY
jgi:hypothetical protein